MANIKDIAQKAGVSISTVSYALNNSDRISETTKNKIITIANQLNYTPNAAGRNLKKKETKIIGAFINNYTAPIYGEILQGIRDILNKYGFELIICSGEQSHRFIPEKMIDGAVILDNLFSNEKIFEYADRGHRMILLDRELTHENVRTVLLNNKQGASLALRYLIKKGHQNLYVIKGPKLNYDNAQRLQTVRKILSKHPKINFMEFQGDFTKQSGKEISKEIHKKLKFPAAVFSLNDEMAIGFYQYIKKTDIVVGKDIDVIGFDNIELSSYLTPPLTSISYSRNQWGSIVANQLLRLIYKKDTTQQRVNLKLVERDSSQMSLNSL